RQKTHGRGAGRVPENRHAMRIATKGGNVGPDPFEPRNQILNAVSSRAVPAFAAQLGVCHETVGTETIGKADEYHAFARVASTVIHGDAGRASDEPAALNP